MMEEKQKDLELKELEACIGTEHYYNLHGVFITDGIKYIMENGYSWFITDSIANIKLNNRIKEYLDKDWFLTIKLNVEDNKAVVTYEDGNDHIIYKQRYEYTDAKRNITLYYTDNALMLNNEY